MGRKLKDYAEGCRQAGAPFVPDDFFSVHYPGKSDRPPCNLHALVGTLLCLPSSSRDSAPVAGGLQVAQLCPATEQVVELPAGANRQPHSWSTGARAERRHKLQVNRALERGELTLNPEEQTATRRLIESVDVEVARRCAQTDLRRGVWGQAAPQRLRSHITTEASRVVTEVPDVDLGKLQEENAASIRRSETRKKSKRKKRGREGKKGGGAQRVKFA